MALNTGDDVVLRLAIKGADPSEVRAQLGQTLEVIRSQTAASLAQLTEAHQRANSARTDVDKKAAADAIAAAKARLGQTIAIEKEMAAAQIASAKQAASVIANERRAADAAVKASYAAVLEAHRKFSAAQTDDARKQAKDEVRATEEKARQMVAGLDRLKSEHRSAMIDMKTNWRGWLEVAENATTVLTGFWGVVSAGFSRFKQFGEEVVRTTQIFQSNHVEIESAKEAIDGTASSLELITAANKATQLDLALTGKQFADVARQAKNFSDATGTGSVEALDALVTGLANGNMKLLKHAGIKFDVDKAERAFAKSIGTTSDQLSQQGKILAAQEHALSMLADKSAAAATEMKKPLDVSHQLEQSFAGMKDEWDAFVFAVGNTEIDGGTLGAIKSAMQAISEFTASAIHGWLVEFPHAIRLAVAAMKDGAENIKGAFGFRKDDDRNRFVDQENAKYGAQLEIEQKRAAAKLAKSTAVAPERPDRKELIDPSKAKKGKDQFEFTGIDRLLFYAAQADAQRKLDDDIENRKADELASLLADFEKTDLNEGLAERYTSAKMAPTYLGERFTAEEGTGLARSVSTMGQEEAEGKSKADALSAQREALGRQKRNVEQTFTDLQGKVSVIGMDTVQDGPGIIERMMFGPSGSPDVLYDKMTEAQKVTYDATQEMTKQMEAAGQGMANAIGSSAAAALSGEQSFGAAMKASAKSVLVNLSSMAIAEGIMEVARGFRDSAAAATFYASGNIPQGAMMSKAATAHFVSAAKFGAVGVVSGLAAGAVGSIGSGGSGGGASVGDTPTAKRTPPSSTGTGSGGGGSDRAVTFVINAPLGDPVAVGRAMDEAFQKYRQQTGREIGERR